ncbi:transposase [Streptomyces mirabilis]|uniref:transposase n=1 Tax=Streptomyces mirabilis TaxID=68239 RepID=UPI0036511CA6
MGEMQKIRTGRHCFRDACPLGLRDQVPAQSVHRCSSDNKLWSGSYFAGTVGSAPLSVVKQYIEQRSRPV